MKEKEWIVRVYRQSSRDKSEGGRDDGDYGGFFSSGADNGGLLWKRAVAKNAKGKIRAIKAIPQRGLILLPKIRSRISLVKSPEACGGDRRGTQHEVGTLVPLQRRGDALLVRGGGRSRTLVLRFGSEKDCLDFTDRLVALNSPPAVDTSHDDATTGSKCHRNAPSHEADDREPGDESDPAADDEAEEVAAYLARLLVDPEIEAFANALEACIASRPDLQSMLEAHASSAREE